MATRRPIRASDIIGETRYEPNIASTLRDDSIVQGRRLQSGPNVPVQAGRWWLWAGVLLPNVVVRSHPTVLPDHDLVRRLGSRSWAAELVHRSMRRRSAGRRFVVLHEEWRWSARDPDLAMTGGGTRDHSDRAFDTKGTLEGCKGQERLSWKGTDRPGVPEV